MVPRAIRPYGMDCFFFGGFMKEFVLFVMTFFFTLLLYELFIVRRAKREKKKKEPIEVTYLVSHYHLDLKKLSYNQLLQIVAIVSSLDISIVVSLILLISNFFLEILVGFVSVIVLIFVSYHMVYLFYKKKGCIKHE